MLEETAALRTKIHIQSAFDELRRQADKLLLMATRSGDMQLVKEAESVYKQLEADVQPRSKAATR
ncbi:hypothetical protein D3C81_2108840 [compost metagenome]